MTPLAPYSVKAFNTATASANRMHDDDVARSLGFRGGLVPGVDVYAYLCHVPAEQWGRAWLEGGTMSARFSSPVYDGDEVTVVNHQRDETQLELRLVDSTGNECAVATATLTAEPAAPCDIDAWPSGPPPEQRPVANPATLTARPFGQLAATFRSDRAAEYLDDIREHGELFRDQAVAHPGWLLRFANFVLTANVQLGPWIHVESRARFFGVVADGDQLETRAIVTGVSERSGHRFVNLDVLQVVGSRVVARTAHTAIYQPRGT